jgi:hypothetical protein
VQKGSVANIIANGNNVKFCIEHPFNIYKVIQFFILLSDLQALISNIILEGKRSLNPPSTPSRLNFILLPLSFVHYHLSTSTPALTFSLPTSHVDSAVSPSPLLRDVGSKFNTPASSERTSPLPFRQGYEPLIFFRQRFWSHSTEE